MIEVFQLRFLLFHISHFFHWEKERDRKIGTRLTMPTNTLCAIFQCFHFSIIPKNETQSVREWMRNDLWFTCISYPFVKFNFESIHPINAVNFCFSFFLISCIFCHLTPHDFYSYCFHICHRRRARWFVCLFMISFFDQLLYCTFR